MSLYIIDNYLNELNNICHTPTSYIISKNLFFDSLSKRQIEMKKNNEKAKFLKSLKHLEFINSFEKEINDIINNKIYTISNTIINENNILKQIIKYWEKEIVNFKDISKECPISDIIMIEKINAEKSGSVKNIITSYTNTIEIKATYGLHAENSNYDTYTISNELKKDIVEKKTLVKIINGQETEELLNKNNNSQVLSDGEIERVKKLSTKINNYSGKTLDFSFAIKDNKIYILNTQEISLTEDCKIKILFPNIDTEKYQLTQVNVQYSDYSFYNLLYKSKLSTYNNLFFINTNSQNLLFFENNIFENKSLLNDLIKQSASYQFNIKWFNNYIFNIEQDINSIVNYTYSLEMIRFLYKLYKQYKNINKNIDIIKDKIMMLDNFINHNENNISDLINYLNIIKNIIDDIVSLLTYNDIYCNILENIIKRKNNLDKQIILYSLCDFKIISDLNKISQQLPIEIKEILIKEEFFKLDNFIDEKVDLDIFYDTHKGYFMNQEKTFIYKIIANWEPILETETKHFKMQDKYIKCIKNIERLTLLTNELYSLYNNLLTKIGSLLVLSNELNTDTDIYYLTIEEILAYFNCFPQKNLLKVTVANRKEKVNFSLDFKVSSNTINLDEIIMNFNDIDVSNCIIKDKLTELLLRFIE